MRTAPLLLTGLGTEEGGTQYAGQSVDSPCRHQSRVVRRRPVTVLTRQCDTEPRHPGRGNRNGPDQYGPRLRQYSRATFDHLGPRNVSRPPKTNPKGAPRHYQEGLRDRRAVETSRT